MQLEFIIWIWHSPMFEWQYLLGIVTHDTIQYVKAVIFRILGRNWCLVIPGVLDPDRCPTQYTGHVYPK
jgi:hypothetical protein